MARRDLIEVLREAKALEDAGAPWQQRHAAAVTGFSVSFLRNSDCPCYREEGNGPKGKPRISYVPTEVRAWKAARMRKVAA